ncbi:hypothetical protein B0T26DRAFT_142684 [Lasiosphaeria miniovina]|uniref:Secreted protein n=1 Tax=Lasiosphaeria miniovina TaxID=1954250 RepID=A0AA40B5E5_9PEZI|nr:uncharacterized protein B0T26DRAFT_142684 [Lasiosphaeria miniovina]KAK0727688.1 hypothetical protein B0T26DRAFT_142684 [Lasiosphaeria miniovina]
MLYCLSPVATVLFPLFALLQLCHISDLAPPSFLVMTSLSHGESVLGEPQSSLQVRRDAAPGGRVENGRAPVELFGTKLNPNWRVCRGWQPAYPSRAVASRNGQRVPVPPGLCKAYKRNCGMRRRSLR